MGSRIGNLGSPSVGAVGRKAGDEAGFFGSQVGAFVQTRTEFGSDPKLVNQAKQAAVAYALRHPDEHVYRDAQVTADFAHQWLNSLLDAPARPDVPARSEVWGKNGNALSQTRLAEGSSKFAHNLHKPEWDADFKPGYAKGWSPHR